MGWWENAKSVFGDGGDGGNVGCFPRIGRRQERNSYAFPADPGSGKRRGSRGPVPEEVITVEAAEVPLRELNEITASFSGEKLIGQGSYAKVYQVTLRSGRLAVVKRLEKPSKHASNVVFLKQLGVASRLQHDNFVRLLGYTIHGDLRVLVYEFATMGTLYDVLHGDREVLGLPPPDQGSGAGRPVLSWIHRVHIALDAARGLEYLHEMVQPAVTHKDVRSTNVPLFEGFRAKIADYNMFSQAADMARLNRSTHTLGSFGYQAPEYAMTGQMTDKSDVYSFGIVLLELLTGNSDADGRRFRNASIRSLVISILLPELSSSGESRCSVCSTIPPSGRPWARSPA